MVCSYRYAAAFFSGSAARLLLLAYLRRGLAQHGGDVLDQSREARMILIALPANQIDGLTVPEASRTALSDAAADRPEAWSSGM